MVTSDLNSAGARLRSAPVVGATIALTAGVAAGQSTLATSVLRAVMVALLVPCAVIDIERRVIPNKLTGPGALVAIALGVGLDLSGEPHRLLWAALAGGFLLISALAYPAGMGMGDVKLVAMMGLFLGAPVVVALLLALLGNVCAAGVLAARHGVKAALKTGLPFGPYLAFGGLVAALAGDPIIQAYLSLHR
jgi:leader peptidase (prepilin peptidase)/N-methyltransferase